MINYFPLDCLFIELYEWIMDIPCCFSLDFIYTWATNNSQYKIKNFP